MGRHRKKPSELKTHRIKFQVTETEYNLFMEKKKKLLDYYPTLSASDIFRKVALNIDDLALISYLELKPTHIIKTTLLSDFLFTHFHKPNKDMKLEN